MRLFIIGANGRTGTELIDLALARGHRVTAFVRAASKITRTHPKLEVAVGDPRDGQALAKALAGHDAVLSALGVRAKELFHKVTLVRECMASTVAAMTRVGVARIVFVSAAVLFPIPGPRFAFFRWFLRNLIDDLVAAEQVLSATDLEWTVARPPKLDGSSAETYRALDGDLPRGAWEMSYRAVAAFMLDAIEQNAHQRQIVGLAS